VLLVKRGVACGRRRVSRRISVILAVSSTSRRSQRDQQDGEGAADQDSEHLARDDHPSG
jgi:hypothetical protein